MTPSEQTGLSEWIAWSLEMDAGFPATELLQASAESEGMLPWLAWRLHESKALNELPAKQQEDLRHSLRHWSLMHLDCEAELEQLVQSAAERGLRFIAFKGHSVSRTLYPNPACRPTSDFDLLIDPGQVGAAREWLASMSFSPMQGFAGTLWLGAQSWSSSLDGNARFHVDLHWDYSNRMYFRKRLGFEEIWAGSLDVPCGEAMLRVPCQVDDLILACVHLAAFDPGMHVRLIWLLDIYLLMAALEDTDIASLLERAEMAHAIEACLVFGKMAAELGDETALKSVLDALKGVANDRRIRFYNWTLRWRAFDLGAYWVRLSWSDKVLFFRDAIRWVKVRNRG